ncbi:type 4 prepilin-like proteins leader peptide-processing enzyme [Neiella marina]|uniref:Prepilin leader peptidase/N-methyltransferase n=1 Tax=Neiella marina TaxID=508461 RepID=A0A8J2U4I0_9GAMM|nr:A24 family peptidase [Neiella marina]GGA74533.1 type 4 prepilin-like proteins leader peptide-processing enzyme [Neiella marina]
MIDQFTQAAAASPLLISAICFVFAALVGSFLNVVIYRLPVMIERHWQIECAALNDQPAPQFDRFNLIVPGSQCGSCGTTIKPWHNLPIVGWFILRGKCAACGQPYSIRYPLIELLTACLSVLVLHVIGFNGFGLAAVVFTWLLICLTFIDIDHYLLPDPLNYVLLWLGLLVHIVITPHTLADAVIGAIAGYLTLWSVYWAFKLLTGKEGMGFGDFKLLAALGAWLGWQLLPLVVLLSSAVGAVLGIAMIVLKGRDHQKPIPFGPYLAIAGWIALLWGNDILDSYFAMLGY